MKGKECFLTDDKEILQTLEQFENVILEYFFFHTTDQKKKKSR